MATRIDQWSRVGDQLVRRGRAARAISGRATLVPGTYHPVAGVTAGLSDPSVTFTEVTGNATFSDTTSAFKLVRNTIFGGHVFVPGRNYIFENCKGIGLTSGQNDAIWQFRYSSSLGNIVRDSEIDPQTPSNGVNGMQGRGFTAERLYIHDCVDLLDPAVVAGETRTDVAVTGCVLSGYIRYCPYTGQTDNQTHSDIMQWQGGLGLKLVGNVMSGILNTALGTGWSPAIYDGAGKLISGHKGYPTKPTGTSVLMINALGNTINPGELEMRLNWLEGGEVGVNSVGVPNAWMVDDGSVITNNWYLNNQGAGTNHRWVGVGAGGSLNPAGQPWLQTHVNAGTNWLWDKSNPMSTATVLAPIKVNL